MINSTEVHLNTIGRSLEELSDTVEKVVQQSGIRQGLCHLFLHHTSASLLLCENADPSVQTDLEAFFSRLVPDGDARYTHRSEGPDDMPAHIRTILTQNSISIPVVDGRLALGTWQGIYLYEHRYAPHRRRMTITIMG